MPACSQGNFCRPPRGDTITNTHMLIWNTIFPSRARNTERWSGRSQPVRTAGEYASWKGSINMIADPEALHLIHHPNSIFLFFFLLSSIRCVCLCDLRWQAV